MMEMLEVAGISLTTSHSNDVDFLDLYNVSSFERVMEWLIKDKATGRSMQGD